MDYVSHKNIDLVSHPARPEALVNMYMCLGLRLQQSFFFLPKKDLKIYLASTILKCTLPISQNIILNNT